MAGTELTSGDRLFLSTMGMDRDRLRRNMKEALFGLHDSSEQVVSWLVVDGALHLLQGDKAHVDGNRAEKFPTAPSFDTLVGLVWDWLQSPSTQRNMKDRRSAFGGDGSTGDGIMVFKDNDDSPYKVMGVRPYVLYFSK